MGNWMGYGSSSRFINGCLEQKWYFLRDIISQLWFSSPGRVWVVCFYFLFFSLLPLFSQVDLLVSSVVSDWGQRLLVWVEPSSPVGKLIHQALSIRRTGGATVPCLTAPVVMAALRLFTVRSLVCSYLFLPLPFIAAHLRALLGICSLKNQLNYSLVITRAALLLFMPTIIMHIVGS